MEYLNLGRSNLKVSRIGFGCCPMGGHGWGNVEKKKLEKAVDLALDGGVNFFDTADIYGLGISEERLGSFLQKKRQRAVIATKFGIRQDSNGKMVYDNSPEWLDQALGESLKRLKTDYIDLYQVHYSDNRIPLDKVFEHLDKKCREGKIRLYGVTNIDLSNIEIELSKNLVSFSFEYSLANREKESVVKEIIEKKRVSFFSWGSLGQGILSGKYNSSTTFSPDDRRGRTIYKNFHGIKLQQNINMLKEMELLVAKRNSISISQLSVRWILDNIKSSVALIGIKEPQEIVDLISSTNWKLNSEELKCLDTISK